MAKKFLVDLDLLQNEIRNGVFQHLAAAPENPKEGQFYYNTVAKKFYVFEDNKWNCFDSATEMLEKLALKADKAYTGTLVTGGVATELAPAVSEIATQVNTNTAAIATLNGTDSEEGSVAKSIKDAIEALDSDKDQTAGDDGLALHIKLEDGKVTELTGSIAAETYDEFGAASAVQGNTTETVKSVDDKVTTLNGNDTVEGSVAKSIKDAIEALDSDKDQTAGADGLALHIKLEDGKVTELTGSIAAETYDDFGAAAAVQGDTTATVESVEAAVAVLNGGATEAGSVAKSIADALGTVTSTNYVVADATVNANISTLDAQVKAMEEVATGTTVVVDEEAGTATVTKGETSFTTYVKAKEDTLLDTKADKATTLAGYNIGDAYTKDEIDGMIASTFHYKGTKQTYAELPTEGNVTGDVWNIIEADVEHGIDAGDNVAWTGTEWDVLGGTTDLSAYALKADVAAADAELADAIADAKDELHKTIVGCKKVALNPELTPVGGVVTWEIAHTYGEDVEVAVKESATGEEVVVNVLQTNNLVTIKFNASEKVAANTYRAVVMGVVPYTTPDESGK